MTLSINVVSASSAAIHSPIHHAITAMAASLAKNSHTGIVPQSPSLDVTFMLPGILEKPLFTGMRMGGYGKTDKTLYFEKAVPLALLESPLAINFVALVIEDVITNAAEFFHDTHDGFNISAWNKLLTYLTPLKT